jgi:hypothetical protein
MRSNELAQQVTEGGNLLAVFLCTGALERLRASGTPSEVSGVLGEGVAKYAPAFRAMRKLVRGAKDVELPIQRLQALVRFGLDLDRPDHVADLRGAIREILSNLGFDLPRHAAGRGVVCELHGRECPVPEGEPGGAKGR